MTELDVANMAAADTARRENNLTEVALAAIYAALFPNAELGWQEWFDAAAEGTWS